MEDGDDDGLWFGDFYVYCGCYWSGDFDGVDFYVVGGFVGE